MANPPPPFNPSGPGYKGAGIRTSVTGTVYQIELLMLLMNRGLRAGCTFNVATEVASAGAFDDLVFIYDTGTINGVLFLQAKHRTNADNKIRDIDLTKVVNGDFYVPKYFESYRRIIKKNKEFKGDMKHFVIYTPINIDDDILHNFEEVPSPHVFAENDFLCFDPVLLPHRKPDNHPKFLKVCKGTDFYKNMVKLLSKNTERLIVAEKLGKTIAINNAIMVEEVFKKHRDWLLEKVFDGDNKTTKNNKVYIKFKESFLKNTETEEDIELLEFRKVVLQSYSETQYKKGTKKENDLTDEVSERKNIIDTLIKENENIQVPETFLTSNYKKLQLIGTTMKEVESFLDKFVFATNQPNNDELKKIIQQEIGEMMNLMLDDSQWVESRLQSCVLDWLRAEKAHYVTNENCEAFFEYVKQKLAIWSQTSLSLENVSQIGKCGCTFSTGNLIEALNSFLAGECDPNILCVYYTNKLLTQIKLCQTTRSYIDKNVDFIFSELEKLSRHLGSKMCPIKALTSDLISHVFLEIDNCSNLSNEQKELLQKIMIFFQKDTVKRLVVMVSKDQQTSWEKIMLNCNNKSLNDSENKFSDLTEESKEMLLKTATVRFNGKKFRLGTLDKTLIDRLSGDTLCELINDNVNLKCRPADVLYDADKKYYVKRTFLRSTILDESIVNNQSFHVIDDRSDDDNQDRNHQSRKGSQEVPFNDLIDSSNSKIATDKKDILVVTKRRGYYSKVCQKYSDRNVLWVSKHRSEVNAYVLQQCKGIISQFSSNDDNILHDYPGKIIIVTAAPGMGKSTLLSRIETNPDRYCPGYFCIRANLVHHCELFIDLFENDITKESIRFLYKASRLAANDFKGDICDHITVLVNGSLQLNASSRATSDELLRFSIFCHVYNEGNIILLLDAFDEISPDYEEQVIQLIKKLKVMKVFKILITSRPYDGASKIENIFNTISYIMQPLSIVEQRQLLLSYWKKLQNETNVEINEIKIKKFLDLLWKSESIKNQEKSMTDFLRIPHHIAMFAEVAEKRFLEFLTKEVNESDGEEYTLFTNYTLFKKFFQIKLKDKMPDFLNPVNKPKDIMKKAIIDHGKLALLEFYHGKCNALVSEDDSKKLRERVRSGDLKLGFVYSYESVPRFVHRTYAEFFVTEYLTHVILNSEEKAAEATEFLYKIMYEVLEHSNMNSLTKNRIR